MSGVILHTEAVYEVGETPLDIALDG